MAGFEKHLFICTNERDNRASRPSCLRGGSKRLKGAFKDAIKQLGSNIGFARTNPAALISVSMVQSLSSIRKRSGMALSNYLM
jgi:hypothetical protein